VGAENRDIIPIPEERAHRVQIYNGARKIHIKAGLIGERLRPVETALICNL